MSEFLKPQSPLKHKDGAYIYPLTTADQVILENGNRLNAALNDMSSKPKAGFIYPLASSVVPEGFLLCDGAEYGRTEFPELFAAIGTIYGNGNGSTTFNVPNLQTRVLVGAGNGYELGSSGGEAEHALTVDEMPSHSHSTETNYIPITTSGSSSWAFVTNDSENKITKSGNQWGWPSASGGSQSHNNMQPYTVVNYIIATGKDTGVSVSDIIMGAQALPLEVQYGGTGATTLKDVRHNLGVNVRNLLDNSDFTNPVNQRGQTSYSGQCYGIDRWRQWLETDNVTIEDGYIVVSGNGIHQSIEAKNFKNTFYTFVAKTIDGHFYIVVNNPFSGNDVNQNNLLFTSKDANGLITVALRGGSYTWAALYEGEYTAETLPEYQPKGYGAELAECLRYFERLGGHSSEVLGNTVYVVGGFSSFISSISYYPKRVPNPTVQLYDPSNYRLLCKTADTAQVFGATDVESFGDITAQSPFATITVNLLNAVEYTCWAMLQRADNSDSPYIDISADL